MSRPPTATSPGDAAPADRRWGAAGLARWRARVRALPGGWVAWRVGVTAVGVAVIVGGIILLPLPGPGWLIIFAGLGILATEYEWAARLLRYARDQVSRWTHWVGGLPRWRRWGVIAALAIFVVAIVLGVYWLYRQI